MGYGLEIRIPGVRYNTKTTGFPRRVKQNISDVTIQENLPYMGTSIQMAPSFQPLFAENDEIEWSITDGSTYASINSNTGKLTINQGTITQMVKVRVQSRQNASIFDEKEIVLTYKELPEIDNQSFQIIVEDLQQQYDYVSDDIWYTIKAYMQPANTDYLSFNVLQNTDCDFCIPMWDVDNKLLIQFRLKGEQRDDTTTTVRIYSDDDNLFYRDISFNVHIPFVITTSNLSRDAYYGVDTSFTYDSSPKFEQYLDTSLSVQILNDMNDVSWGYVNSSDGLSGIVNLQYNNTLNRDITFRITNSSLGVYTDKVVPGLFVQNVNLTYDGENTYFYKTRTDVPWGQPGAKYTDNRDTVYSFNIGTQPNLNRSMHVEVINDASLVNVLQVENVYNTDNLVSGLTVSFKLVSPSGNCDEYGTVKFRVYDDTGYLNDTQSIKFFIIPKSDEVQNVMTINTPYLDSSYYTTAYEAMFENAYLGLITGDYNLTKNSKYKTTDTSVLYEVEDGVISAEKDIYYNFYNDIGPLYTRPTQLLRYNTLKDASGNTHYYQNNNGFSNHDIPTKYSIQQMIDKSDYGMFDSTHDYANRRYLYTSMIEQYPPMKFTFTVYPNVRREMKVTALTNGIKDLSTYIEIDSSTRMTAHIEFYLIPKSEIKYDNDTSKYYVKYWDNEIIRIEDSLNSSKYIDYNITSSFQHQGGEWEEWDVYYLPYNGIVTFTNNIPIIYENEDHIEYVNNYSYDYLYCMITGVGPDIHKSITKVNLAGNIYQKENDWPFETINIPWKYTHINDKSMLSYLTRYYNKVYIKDQGYTARNKAIGTVISNYVSPDRYKESYIGRLPLPDTLKVSYYNDLTDNRPLAVTGLFNEWYCGKSNDKSVLSYDQTYRNMTPYYPIFSGSTWVYNDFSFYIYSDFEPEFYRYSSNESEFTRFVNRYNIQAPKYKIGNGNWINWWYSGVDYSDIRNFDTIYFDIDNTQKWTIVINGNILRWFANDDDSNFTDYSLLYTEASSWSAMIKNTLKHNQNTTYSPAQFYNTFVDKIQGLPGWNTLIAKIANNPTNVTLEDRIYKSGLITVDYTGIIWPLIVP